MQYIETQGQIRPIQRQRSPHVLQSRAATAPPGRNEPENREYEGQIKSGTRGEAEANQALRGDNRQAGSDPAANVALPTI